MLQLTAQKRHRKALKAIERYPKIIKNEMNAFQYLKYLDLEAKAKPKMKQGELKELFYVTLEWFLQYKLHCYADLIDKIALKQQINISKA